MIFRDSTRGLYILVETYPAAFFRMLLIKKEVKIDKSKQAVLNQIYVLDSVGDKQTSTKLHTMKGLFEINNFYKIKWILLTQTII